MAERYSKSKASVGKLLQEFEKLLQLFSDSIDIGMEDVCFSKSI